jgi:putative addiction module component
MRTLDAILQEARQLSVEDRAFLADVLEGSLDRDDFASKEISALWSAEIDHRIAAYLRGESISTDIETAMDRVSKSLENLRSQRHLEE